MQEDLARVQQTNRPSSSPASTTISPAENNQTSIQHPEARVVAEALAESIDKHLVPGVTVSSKSDGDVVFVVGWGDGDLSNPLNWSLLQKWVVMATCCLIAIAMTIPSSIEGAVQEAFDAHYGITGMAGSMTTGKRALPKYLFFFFMA